MVEPPKARGGQRGLLLPIPLKSTRCTVSRAPGERVHLDGPNYNAFDVKRSLTPQAVRVADGDSSPDVVQYHAGHLHVTRRNFDNHVIADHGVVPLRAQTSHASFIDLCPANCGMVCEFECSTFPRTFESQTRRWPLGRSTEARKLCHSHHSPCRRGRFFQFGVFLGDL